MFVSSWVLNADMWEYQVRFFRSHGYRCILPDRRGHGRSDRPPNGYDLDTRADDLASSEPPGSGSSPPPCRS